MRRFQSLCVCAVVGSMIMLVGCSSGGNVDTASTTIQTQQNGGKSEVKSLSYANYASLYSDMVNNLQFPNYSKVDDNLSTPEVVIVDKEVTFGTREVLTVSGKSSDTRPQPTQKRIVYQNAEQGTVLYIDFAYLTQFVGNDLVSWDGPPPEKLKGMPNLDKIKQVTLSYKNTLAKVELISTTDKPPASAHFNELLHVVVDFLQTNGSKYPEAGK